MPLITTNISYEYEEGGRNEYTTYCREVADLDVQDILWYLVSVLEHAGYDCKELQLTTNQNKVYRTDL